MNTENARVAMCLLAQREVGSSLYWWGGDGVSGRKELGRDCSGLVCTILADLVLAYPDLYDGQRRTARDIYDYYHAKGLPDITSTGDLRPGSLVFFNHTGRRIHHIKIHLAVVPDLQLGGTHKFGPIAVDAGGGGSDTVSPRRALERAAQVRFSASDVHGSAKWRAKDPFALLG
jgi:hypothetical protein